MQLDVNVFHSFPPSAEVLSALHSLLEKVQTMSKTIDDLVSAVSEQSGKVESMTAFIGGLEKQINDALKNVNLPPDAQAKVDAVFAGLSSNTQAIADAIDADPATPASATGEPVVEAGDGEPAPVADDEAPNANA